MLASMKKKLAERGIVRDENGSIIVFVMVVFSAMFLVGGTAVDLARHENLRSSLQYNLDRAVLAAASLRQTQDPDIVVQDYMSKITAIEDFTVEVTSSVAINARSVSATATANLDTWFLSMAGINKMPITARSASEERVPNLEISLVLDVLGSMDGTKLTNLKVAAKQFVTTLLTNADPDTVAISVVPFNHNVSPSDSIFDNLTIAETHSLSNCLDFSDLSFESAAIDPSVSQTQAVFTALYGGFQNFNGGSETCYADTESEILPYSDNVGVQHTKIDGLYADGWTAAHLGMKLGLALLDPNFQSVTTVLADNGTIDEGFADLPVAYGTAQTKKVIVLMGDGANTYEFAFGNNYSTGLSNVWEIVEEEPGAFTHLTYYGRTYTGAVYEQYCSWASTTCFYGDPVQVTNFFIKKQSNGQFYGISDGSWVTATVFNNLLGAAGVVSTEQLSWPEAWGHMPAQYYDSITGENAFSDLIDSGRGTTEADTAMTSSCNAAETAGVIVYTIGYETSTTTSDKLRDCASTASHFYDASGTQISEVFSAIATSIQRLKLTQ